MEVITSNILIVEDSPDGREILELLLGGQGYQLAFAENGARALAMAEHLQPELVLLDVMIPDIDGFEVCRRLRASPTLAEVPIVLVTALDDRESRLQGIAAGADDFITKPFDLAELRARVWSILRLNRYRRLLDERSKFDHMVELLPSGMAVVDAQQRIMQVNRALIRLLGAANADELLGRLLADFLLAPTAERCRQLIAGAIREDAPASYTEVTLRRLDGGLFPAEIDIGGLPLRDHPAAALIIRDISDRKQAEAQRLAMERRLLEAQKLESLGLLAGGIAHDFNNLLTVILSNVNLAQLVIEAGSPIHESIHQIETAARHAVDLTRQLFSYAGKGDVRMQPVELNGLIRETIQLLRGSIPASTSILLELAEGPVQTYADVSQLRQVLMNLVLNGADALGTAGGQIKICTALVSADEVLLRDMQLGKDLPPGWYVQLMISDTGAGMSEETCAKIFDPFFTTKAHGRGLGLATVLGIVRGHHGALRVDSALGEGTSFTILLASTADGRLHTAPYQESTSQKAAAPSSSAAAMPG